MAYTKTEVFITCPSCGSLNSHIDRADIFLGGDYPKNEYGVHVRQGGIAVIIFCEDCGRRWANITCEHKGQTWFERRIEKTVWAEEEK